MLYLYPVAQSAYGRNHSNETALLKVMNDILLNMNKQHGTILALLDLSAAFDTFDHSILLNRLSSKLGLNGTALAWFRSYLSGRSQRVSVRRTVSDKFDLRYGVPQGSCLGPLLFTVYASALFDVVEKHLPTVHCYADDSQVYGLTAEYPATLKLYPKLGGYAGTWIRGDHTWEQDTNFV